MGSLNPESDPKQELDDSGYVQDDVSSKEAATPGYKGTTNLLDLSDDVLLYILRYCSPRDLKALAYTCTRLGTISVDRTLWVRVDARASPSGRLRMRWLLTHALNAHTTALLLSGFAREAKGCLGFMRGSRENAHAEDDKSVIEVSGGRTGNEPSVPRMLAVAAQSLRRYGGGFPFWPDRAPHSRAKVANPSDCSCPGPQVTLTSHALDKLCALCTNLTELAMEHCVIDCAKTNISMFPTSLKKLSLRATKCYNLEKSFLFQIQDRLPYLEELDVSLCDWIEPACILPLSKVERLSKLVMRECVKLTEFVAYASLATRYGFKTLKVLDLRGSPVGDSEVSALGWVPRLEELYLSPASAREKETEHAHYTHDPWPSFAELEPWEELEPEYFKSHYASQQWVQNEEQSLDNGDANCVPMEDSAMASCVLLERLFAEPVVPDQYNEVYNRFNPDTHRLNLGTPDDYRQAYGLYMGRPRREQSQHMAFINGLSRRNVGPDGNNQAPNPENQQDTGEKRKNDDEAGPSKRQKTKASKKHYDDKNDDDKSREDKNAKDLPKDEKMDESSDDDDDDDDRRPNVIPVPVNQGASTSKVIVIEGRPSSSRCDFKIQKDGTIQFRNQPAFELPSNNNNNDEPNLNRDGQNLNRDGPNLNVKICTEGSNDGCVNIKLSVNTQDSNSNPEEAGSNLDISISRASGSNQDADSSQSRSQADLNSQPSNIIILPSSSNQTANLNSRPSGSNNQDLNIDEQNLNTDEHNLNRDEQNSNEPGPSGQENKSTNTENSENARNPQRRVVYVNVRQGGALRINNFMPPDFIYNPNLSHRLEYTSLVTDSAIRRFGRADGENINYVQIGPNGPMPAPIDDPNARPNRANLRVLSVTGYRNITNVSLIHLATAAPRLEFLDFSGTSVTNLGVEHFRNFRPNCEVRYGENETVTPNKEPE